MTDAKRSVRAVPVGTFVRIKPGRAFGTDGKIMKVVEEHHLLYYLVREETENREDFRLGHFTAADREDFVIPRRA